ncbi:5-bromo-4-chloroindolyl phosphate hydrolysis family protein [Paenibacillus chartarius]|uniref:5-bromo-4-chloroindolyl phosphate hydrolysis family protein n=1 Tax=Paenibacillus chartarius TaxID=747481 RepID=A0ABV6DS69_9BACL
MPQVKIILATALSAAAFLVFLFALDFGVILSAVLGAAIYGALQLLLTTTDPTIRLYGELLREARRKLHRLREASGGLRSRVVRGHVDEIIAITNRVIAFTEKKATQLPEVRQMLSFYLDATVQIVTAYAETAALTGSDSRAGSDFAGKAEESLEAIRDHFHAQYERLVRSDLSDLTARMEALKEMLDWEGLR